MFFQHAAVYSIAMNYKSGEIASIQQSITNCHCGLRFKTLAAQKGKQSPTYWVRKLGLAARTQVYKRWESKTIRADELLIICEDLSVTISEFFQLPENAVQEPLSKYTKKRYIEQDVEDLIKRMATMETRMQECEKRYSENPGGAQTPK